MQAGTGRSGRRGVSLAEIVVAIGVIGGTLFGMVSLLSVWVRDTRRQYDAAVAHEWLRSEWEVLRCESRAQVLARGEALPGPESGSPGHLLNPETRVEAHPLDGGERAIEVTLSIAWDELGGGRRRLELHELWLPVEKH